jgi:hypothetical protein
MGIVWIDAQQAIVVRWRDGAPRIERIASDVPAHRHSTGHVRHDPVIRHGGGGGRAQTAGEPHRLEHLQRFVEGVASRVAAVDELLILGPGTVREQLQRRVREIDERHQRERSVTCEASPRLTDPQLMARLRHICGADPYRTTVGAYRWSAPQRRRSSGSPVPPPRRVLRKLPGDLDRRPAPSSTDEND